MSKLIYRLIMTIIFGNLSVTYSSLLTHPITDRLRLCLRNASLCKVNKYKRIKNYKKNKREIFLKKITSKLFQGYKINNKFKKKTEYFYSEINGT